MNSIYKMTRLLSMFMVCGALFFSSCKSTQNAVYFSDLDSTKVKEVPMAAFKEPLIQTDDILNITIQTLDVNATSTMNQTASSPAGSAPVSPEAAAMTGFLVDRAGNVEIPILGVLKLAGLTTAAAKDVVRAKAATFYKDPTVQLRFANYKITVLGEVARPATYTMPNEKVTVLDAISMAGDLTIYGKRGNILLMRDNDGKKEIVRLNLNSSSMISSPYFYLRQNDFLYVEPSKSKASANNAARNQLITIGVAIATVLVTIFARF